jgi:hypothetical protein
MLNDGSNTASTTRATTPERTTTSEVRKLKVVQQKLWAVLGLKMAVDRLKDLKYDVVVQQENGCTTIKIELKVDFDFDTGTIGGKDIVAVQTELKNQIEALEGKNGKA